MAFKINISEKSGETYKLETEAEELIDKELHNKINGKDISPELDGYEFEITGASDGSGFPSIEQLNGVGLGKLLLTYGKGMHKRSKREGKKKRSNPRPKGLRLRKTARGKVISPAVVQINLKVLKQGKKSLADIFPEQNKSKVSEVETKIEEKKEDKEQNG